MTIDKLNGYDALVSKVNVLQKQVDFIIFKMNRAVEYKYNFILDIEILVKDLCYLRSKLDLSVGRFIDKKEVLEISNTCINRLETVRTLLENQANE